MLSFAPGASPCAPHGSGFCFKCFPISPFQFFSFCGASCRCPCANCMFPVSRPVSVVCHDPLLNIHFHIKMLQSSKRARLWTAVTDIWSATEQKTLLPKRGNLNSAFKGFMVLILEAKCRCICFSHCDREQWRSRKRSSQLINDLLQLRRYGKRIIGKCRLVFSRITVCSAKPYPACSWRSSLKYTRKCLLCAVSPQPLLGAAQFTAASGHGAGWIWSASSTAELPTPGLQRCDLGILFQMTDHMRFGSACGCRKARVRQWTGEDEYGSRISPLDWKKSRQF